MDLFNSNDLHGSIYSTLVLQSEFYVCHSIYAYILSFAWNVGYFLF